MCEKGLLFNSYYSHPCLLQLSQNFTPKFTHIYIKFTPYTEEIHNIEGGTGGGTNLMTFYDKFCRKLVKNPVFRAESGRRRPRVNFIDLI